MDNQHKLIKGYRDLNQTEIALINAFKNDEAKVLADLDDYRGLVVPEGIDEKTPDGNARFNARSLALARTKFQEAYMWLIRAVARPNGE